MVGVRLGLLVLCSALILISRQGRDEAAAVVMLWALAVAASVPVGSPTVRRWQPTVEAVGACVLVLVLEPLPAEPNETLSQLFEPLLPYLIAPALASGLVGGLASGITTSGLAALTLLLGWVVDDEPGDLSTYLETVSLWGLITLAVGLLAGWVHRLQQVQTVPENAAYAAAYRLISQLRVVSRQLSGGLDPVTLAHGLLENLRASVPFDRGAVYVRSTGGRLSPVAFHGAARLDWQIEQHPFDEAWASSSPVRHDAALSDGTQGFSAVLPLRIGLRTFGLVAVERGTSAFDRASLGNATEVVEEQALRLETALLFSEVRTLATAEERRRLAREIHDGIAQELASLGYVVDDLAARARYLPDLEADLKGLRGELTRVITELRLSIFDLRSEVQSTVGLGTALSDYARQVGAGSNLTVHLVLDEAAVRLPVDAETELLRIAQEAITNARKHARAENLWVTCSVDPPRALVRIEDDGEGLGRPRDDSFGLEVMRERAERIGGRLLVQNRADGGTAVEVSLGPARVPG